MASKKKSTLSRPSKLGQIYRDKHGRFSSRPTGKKPTSKKTILSKKPRVKTTPKSRSKSKPLTLPQVLKGWTQGKSVKSTGKRVNKSSLSSKGKKATKVTGTSRNKPSKVKILSPRYKKAEKQTKNGKKKVFAQPNRVVKKKSVVKVSPAKGKRKSTAKAKQKGTVVAKKKGAKKAVKKTKPAIKKSTPKKGKKEVSAAKKKASKKLVLANKKLKREKEKEQEEKRQAFEKRIDGLPGTKKTKLRRAFKLGIDQTLPIARVDFETATEADFKEEKAKLKSVMYRLRKKANSAKNNLDRLAIQSQLGKYANIVKNINIKLGVYKKAKPMVAETTVKRGNDVDNKYRWEVKDFIDELIDSKMFDTITIEGFTYNIDDIGNIYYEISALDTQGVFDSRYYMVVVQNYDKRTITVSMP